MAMTNEQLTKWIDEIFGTIDEIKQNSGDISGLTRSVKQLREDVTDLEVQTAGTVTLPKAPLQYFTDGSATQALDLVADIIPVQAGTGDPSPTNVRAISGFSSVTAATANNNILDPSKITFNQINVNAYIYSDTEGLYVKQGEKFVFSVSATCNGIYVSEAIDGATSFTSVNNDDHIAFTAPRTMFIKIQVWRNDGVNSLNYQLERGEEATPYSAYDPSTVTLSLGSTVYGGTVNFTTGELYVDKMLVDLSDLSYNYETSGIAHPFFSAPVPGMKAASSGISNIYINAAVTTQNDTDYAFAVTADSTPKLRIRHSDYTDATEFKSYLGTAGAVAVVELATPTTTTLTPEQLQLLQGENNVSATSGPITLTYAPDNVLAEVYAYIQKRFDTLTASLAANRTTRKTTKTLTKKED